MSHEISIMVGPGALALIGTGGSMLVSRDQLGDRIEFLVGLQDICEPEADCETDNVEDDFVQHPANGPGCPISDVDMSIEDERHDDDDPAEEDDPLEGNGDELDGNPAEDEFMHHYGSGAGCPIADPDAAVDDQPCDICADGY